MGKGFYDRISGVYDLISDASEHEAREKGLAALRVAAGERALEIGFGTGHGLESLAEAVGETGGVVGVDISPGMRTVAGRRLAETGLADRVRMITAEVPPLPLPDDSFDVAFASFTLELFDADVIPAVLAEVRRVLHPGGRLGVVSMAISSDPEHPSLVSQAYGWMHRHFPHIVDCRPIDAAALLTEAGFQIEHVETLDVWSLPVSVLAARAPRDSQE